MILVSTNIHLSARITLGRIPICNGIQGSWVYLTSHRVRFVQTKDPETTEINEGHDGSDEECDSDQGTPSSATLVSAVHNIVLFPSLPLTCHGVDPAIIPENLT